MGVASLRWDGRHANNIVDGITFGERWGLITWIRHLLNSKRLSFKVEHLALIPIERIKMSTRRG
jgi:hypothetical protein